MVKQITVFTTLHSYSTVVVFSIMLHFCPRVANKHHIFLHKYSLTSVYEFHHHYYIHYSIIHEASFQDRGAILTLQ